MNLQLNNVFEGIVSKFSTYYTIHLLSKHKITLVNYGAIFWVALASIFAIALIGFLQRKVSLMKNPSLLLVKNFLIYSLEIFSSFANYYLVISSDYIFTDTSTGGGFTLSVLLRPILLILFVAAILSILKYTLMPPEEETKHK